ncbi:aldo/keto reductase [Vagococcus penaei]|uniref:Aldo/keto reductase n=1 Tax=Vagococcus penaei TaxID=633807 RepID=A0A1Q2D7N8_9ENTE|nr:aldo/keto reductase [Vagococcus penaei]AQP54340.1 aldo/keto reductase [Vagococcus penaei]RSU05773.1 aldo/keto reductase [Vagococcus penaei]
MQQLTLGSSALDVSQIGLGCMRMSDLTVRQAVKVIETSLEQGINFFDHADIYGQGQAEKTFSSALKELGINREKVVIQSKCGIRDGYYDFSKEHILTSVDEILNRLDTEYIDTLGLHRPDALVEPEEVAEAFDSLYRSGKVRHFGVSNHNPYQIELLKRYCEQPIEFNQLQFGLMHADMVRVGLNVNNHLDAAIDRDGYTLDYARLNQMTIQAWSPLQHGFFAGTFIGDPEFFELNQVLEELAETYGVTPAGIATAWISQHPAKIQTLIGTMTPSRITEMAQANRVAMTKQEWYRLYRAAGNKLL